MLLLEMLFCGVEDESGSDIPPVGRCAGLVERDEGFEQLGHTLDLGTVEREVKGVRGMVPLHHRAGLGGALGRSPPLLPGPLDPTACNQPDRPEGSRICSCARFVGADRAEKSGQSGCVDGGRKSWRGAVTGGRSENGAPMASLTDFCPRWRLYPPHRGPSAVRPMGAHRHGDLGRDPPPPRATFSGRRSHSTLAITALSVADCPRDCCHLLRGRARPPEAGPLAAGKYPQVVVERRPARFQASNRAWRRRPGSDLNHPIIHKE